MGSTNNKTRLSVTREDAKKRLLDRIEKAGDIHADEIRSYSDLDKAEEKEKRWRDYNETMLSRLFTSEEYADEYRSVRPQVHVISDRYMTPDIGELKRRLVGGVNREISTLRSIIERLELIDKGTAPIATIDGAMQDERNLDLLIERFHLVTRQMQVRHASRSTLQINDEYDVQDLFHGLLMIFFDDIRKEEWTPSYAGGASKIDFLLPSLQTAVEVKKTRSTLTARALGEELIVDIAKYQKHPQCGKLLCFVYDPEGIIANPRGVESDLSVQNNNLAVRVLIVPRIE